MDSSNKTILIALLIIGATVVGVTCMCLVHNEAMAKMGYCQQFLLGKQDAYWVKCPVEGVSK